MKTESLPVVICHKHANHSSSLTFQVYIGQYDRGDHKITDMSKSYECFNSFEETEAYIKGLRTAGAIYGEKS